MSSLIASDVLNIRPLGKRKAASYRLVVCTFWDAEGKTPEPPEHAPGPPELKQQGGGDACGAYEDLPDRRGKWGVKESSLEKQEGAMN